MGCVQQSPTKCLSEAPILAEDVKKSRRARNRLIQC